MAFNTIEKRREYQNKYYHDNREMLVRRQAEWRRDNRKRYTEYHRKYKRKLKREVLTHYGGGKCVCMICGETNIWQYLWIFEEKKPSIGISNPLYELPVYQVGYPAGGCRLVSH